MRVWVKPILLSHSKGGKECPQTAACYFDVQTRVPRKYSTINTSYGPTMTSPSTAISSFDIHLWMIFLFNRLEKGMVSKELDTWQAPSCQCFVVLCCGKAMVGTFPILGHEDLCRTRVNGWYLKGSVEDNGVWGLGGLPASCATSTSIIDRWAIFHSYEPEGSFERLLTHFMPGGLRAGSRQPDEDQALRWLEREQVTRTGPNHRGVDTIILDPKPSQNSSNMGHAWPLFVLT